MDKPGHRFRIPAVVTMAMLTFMANPADATCVATERGRAAVLDAVLEGDADRLASLIDSDALSARIARGMPEDDEHIAAMPRALDRQRTVMAGGLIRSLRSHERTLVAQAPVGQTLAARRTVIVRKQGDTLGSGIDYTLFELGPDGCVVDWSSLLLGTRASAMIRQNLLLARADAGLLATVFGIQRPDARHDQQLQALVKGLRESDSVAALKALDGMKSVARESFELSMLRVSLLSVDHESAAYREALADIAQRFGEDARTQLMLIDHYAYEEDFEGVLRTVAGVQQRVGVDEENEAIRATAFDRLGRADDAIASLRRVVELAPGRPDTHELLVNYLAGRGRSAEAVVAMEVAAAHDFVFDEDKMREDPGYADLLESPEYAAFRKRLAAD